MMILMFLFLFCLFIYLHTHITRHRATTVRIARRYRFPRDGGGRLATANLTLQRVLELIRTTARCYPRRAASAARHLRQH